MLTEKEQRELDNYDGQLNIPKWKFIIVQGLTWLVLVSIFTVILEVFLFKKSIKAVLNPGMLAMMPLAGIAYGAIFRRLILRRYNKLKGKQSL